jgi:hypothetical protein
MAKAHFLHSLIVMPQSHHDPMHAHPDREKREQELLAYTPQALEMAYKVTAELPLDAETGQVPVDAMIDSILLKEFGPID